MDKNDIAIDFRREKTQNSEIVTKDFPKSFGSHIFAKTFLFHQMIHDAFFFVNGSLNFVYNSSSVSMYDRSIANRL